MLKRLKEKSGGSAWAFPWLVTGHPYSADTIRPHHIRPALKKLELPNASWHTFRHSFKSWLGSGEATPTQQKNAMCHAAMPTDAMYGGTPVEKRRTLMQKGSAKVKAKPIASTQ